MFKEKYEIWFLTGAQTLYGDEALRQVDAHSQVVVDRFNACGRVPCKTVYCGTVKSTEEIVQKFRDAHVFAGEDVDSRSQTVEQADSPPSYAVLS